MEDENKFKNFCPTCGYEGNDMECPVCHIPMESLDSEIDKIKEKENEREDLIDDSLSLEEEQQNEQKREDEKSRSDDENL